MTQPYYSKLSSQNELAHNDDTGSFYELVQVHNHIQANK